MTRKTLRLTLDVTYDLNGAAVGDLEDNLLGLAALASRDGLLSQDTEAEVVIADPKVEVLS